jgi:Ni/Co efflux regulator RcnB
MKLFLTTALALSLIGGSAALAQPHGDDRHGQANEGQARDGQARDGQGAGHQWSRGERLPSNYRTADHYVDYRANHLRRPARGHRWVRTDNGSYAEIALATGVIYSIANAR